MAVGMSTSMTIFFWILFFYLGWTQQLWRENGLAQTRRELRRAYREYDELLALIYAPDEREAVRLPNPSLAVEPYRYLRSIDGGESA